MQNLASKATPVDEVDEHYAYAVFLLEKEFNVGPITEDFLAMKFWNLLDEKNLKRYSDSMKRKDSSGKDEPLTLGDSKG